MVDLLFDKGRKCVKMEDQYKTARIRSDELNQWALHSEVFVMGMKVRICEDIVRLI